MTKEEKKNKKEKADKKELDGVTKEETRESKLQNPPNLECKNKHKTDLYEPYVYKGHCMNPPIKNNMESCPIDERKNLGDGSTKAVAYPKAGFNCNPYGVRASIPHSLVQKAPKCDGDPFATTLHVPYEYKPECMNPPLIPSIESCPIDERKTLSDGRTKAIPYPLPNYTCNPYDISN